MSAGEAQSDALQILHSAASQYGHQAPQQAAKKGLAEAQVVSVTKKGRVLTVWEFGRAFDKQTLLITIHYTKASKGLSLYRHPLGGPEGPMSSFFAAEACQTGGSLSGASRPIPRPSATSKLRP